MSVIAFVAAVGCTTDPAGDGNYGYVQFRLFKSGSYETTRADLDYLADVAKIKVSLRDSDLNPITQTITVYGQSKQLSEFGMQSDKFMLLAGTYRVIGYELYGVLDNLIGSVEPVETTYVTVVPGGLVLRDVVVDVVERGFAKFTMIKDLSQITTRATPIARAFHTITKADVTISKQTGTSTWVAQPDITGLKMTHKIFREEDDPDYFTSTCVCDSLVSLPAGTYKVVGFKVYFDDNEDLYEVVGDASGHIFTVEDNQTVEAEIPVTLNAAAGDIKDGFALKAIYDALSQNGYWTNNKWNFDRDPDLWTAQPGVSVMRNGRVATIDLTEMGVGGVMPAALNDLTELRELYLGSHDFVTATSTIKPSYVHTYYTPRSEDDRDIMARSFRRTFIDNGTSLNKFSKELQQSFTYNGIAVQPEGPALRALPTVGNAMNYSNMITSLANVDMSATTTLTKLESLYIGCSGLETLPSDWSGLTALLNLEIYSCPALTAFPAGIPTLTKLQTLIFSGNSGITTDAMYAGLQALNSGTVKNSLLTLQLSGQPLEKVPDLTGMVRLTQFEVQNCGVTQFEKAFGKDITISTFNASHNKLTALPVDANGLFMGVDKEIEIFNCSNNQFTQFPDIFNSASKYTADTVNFSYNLIGSDPSVPAIQNGNLDPGLDADGKPIATDPTTATCKGLNAKFLVLAYNQFSRFPKELFHKASTIGYLQIQGNRIVNMDDDTFDILKATKVPYLTTLDISLNKLSKLPVSFNGENLSFMTGIDLSYNRFDYFPKNNVLNISAMTVLIFRGQRDENGNRIMREWPTGIYNHKGIRALYVGSNDLRLVEDTLSYLIYNFEIKDNPNITINVSDLCPYITAGLYNLMYDPWQDIRGCPALNLEY